MKTPVTMALLCLLSYGGCAPKAPPASTEPTTPTTASAPDPSAPTPGPEAGEGGADRDVEGLVNDAVELLAQTPDTPAKNQKARDMLERAVERAPESAVARFNLGVAHQRLGDLAAAERQYQSAVGIDPALGQAWLHLGYLRDDRGEAEAAITTYRTGIQNDPENLDLAVALVQALRKRGKTDEAITEARAALKVNTNNVGVYNALGQVYMDRGEFDLAKFVFQKAIQGTDQGSESAEINTNLGWTYYRQGQVPYAILRLKQALERDPTLVPALVYLAHIHMDDHNYGDALPLLEKAASQDSDNPDIQLNLGVCYRGLGQLDQAKASYERVLALDPRRNEALFNLGILYGDHLKDYDASVKAFEQYAAAGGAEATRAQEYIKLVQRERDNAERRKKADEERAKREAERAERQKLIEEDDKKKAESKKAGGDAPPETPPESPPAEAPPAPDEAPRAPAPEGGEPEAADQAGAGAGEPADDPPEEVP